MKTKGMAIILTIVAALCTLFAVSVHEAQPSSGTLIAPAQIQIPCYVSFANIYEKLLSPPYEVSLFIFSDGRIFSFTNQLDGAVIYPDLVKFFKKFKLTLADCVLQVHSHPTPSTFSEPDKRFALYLRSHGFRGTIALYIAPTREVKILQ